MNIADLYRRFRSNSTQQPLTDQELLDLLLDTEMICSSLAERGEYYAMTRDALSRECAELRLIARARGIEA